MSDFAHSITMLQNKNVLFILRTNLNILSKKFLGIIHALCTRVNTHVICSGIAPLHIGVIIMICSTLTIMSGNLSLSLYLA